MDGRGYGFWWLPRTWRGWILAAAGLVYVAAALWEPGTDAHGHVPVQADIWQLIVLLGANAVILLADGESFVTLHGRVNWGRLRGWRRAALTSIYCAGFIMPAIYLAAVAHDIWLTRRPIGR